MLYYIICFLVTSIIKEDFSANLKIVSDLTAIFSVFFLKGEGKGMDE